MRRLQKLLFDLTRDLTRDLIASRRCEIPAHALFPQLFLIAQRYAAEKVQPLRPFEVRDAFLSPYYGWIMEGLTQAVKPDAGAGEIMVYCDVCSMTGCPPGERATILTKRQPDDDPVASRLQL